MRVQRKGENEVEYEWGIDFAEGLREEMDQG